MAHAVWDFLFVGFVGRGFMRDVENIVKMTRRFYEIEFVGLFIYITYSKAI